MSILRDLCPKFLLNKYSCQIYKINFLNKESKKPYNLDNMFNIHILIILIF